MGKWKKLNFSITGKKHYEKGKKCQDATYGKILDDKAVIAVADGAGSSKYSDIGSKIAVNCFAYYALSNFDQLYKDDISTMFDYIRKKIYLKSKIMNVDYEELNTTLIGIAIKDNKYIAIHIGDGILASITENGLTVLSEGLRGEFANETYFLNSVFSDKKAYICKGHLDGINGFIAFTDGLERNLYDKRKKEFASLIYKLIDWINKEEETSLKRKIKKQLKNLGYKLTNDDISLAILKNYFN